LLIISTLVLLLRAYQWVMLITAVLSWIPSLHESRFYYFLRSITDPVVYLVRGLIYKIPGADSIPIDLSFLAVYLIISLLINILI